MRISRREKETEMIEGKIWGRTSVVFENESFSVHVLEVYPGGYSSDHSHRSKWNFFHVFEGEFSIFKEVAGMTDETILRSGDSLTVAPGVVHRFHARTFSRVLEIYFSRLAEDDILRKNVGGIRPLETIERF